MTSSTNEAAIKRRNQQQARDLLTDKIITQQLMSTDEGRRWVWLRLEEGHLYSNDEGLDPMRMAFDKGQRNAALRLLRDVNRYAASEYILMANEAQTIASYINSKDPNYVRSPDDTDFDADS